LKAYGSKRVQDAQGEKREQDPNAKIMTSSEKRTHVRNPKLYASRRKNRVHQLLNAWGKGGFGQKKGSR